MKTHWTKSLCEKGFLNNCSMKIIIKPLSDKLLRFQKHGLFLKSFLFPGNGGGSWRQAKVSQRIGGNHINSFLLSCFIKARVTRVEYLVSQINLTDWRNVKLSKQPWISGWKRLQARNKFVWFAYENFDSVLIKISSWEVWSWASQLFNILV